MSGENLNSRTATGGESDPGWMTKKELCRRWKQCAKTIERRVSEGKLAVHYLNKSPRFALKDVLAFEGLSGGACV
jgi:hypothetical protein